MTMKVMNKGHVQIEISISPLTPFCLPLDRRRWRYHRRYPPSFHTQGHHLPEKGQGQLPWQPQGHIMKQRSQEGKRERRGENRVSNVRKARHNKTNEERVYIEITIKRLIHSLQYYETGYYIGQVTFEP